MELEKYLQEGISVSLKTIFNIELSPDEIKIIPTRKEFEGSHTYTTFPLTKYITQSPEEIGNILGQYLTKSYSGIAGYNIVKGFLNITFSDRLLTDGLKLINEDENSGQLPFKHENVMVEFSSPNTNKPLHLGHLRNNFLGDSVSRILKASGYHVIKANLINDRGIHICKSMLAYQKFGHGETPQSENLKGDKLAGKYYVEFDKQLRETSLALKQKGWTDEDLEKKNPLLIEAQEMLLKWEEGDPEVLALWKKMNGWVYEGFQDTYNKIGISFDQYYYESNTYLLGKEVVDEGLQKGIFFKKDDGSVWIDLTEEGLDQKLVLRSDGTSVYITQDMGTADLKYRDYALQKSVYVVGNEQDYHFIVLKHIMKKLGRPYAAGMYHLSYGMVDLPSGKMKSREGTVVDADDIIDEMIGTAAQMTKELGKIDGFTDLQAKELYSTLGLGALKYFLIKVDPKKRMMFNPAESIDFHGHTGPFIQYTHARICAIIRKANELSISGSHPDIKDYPLHLTEKNIIVHLFDYKKALNQAAGEYSPAIISQYVYELAKLYNTFYAELSIFNESNAEVIKLRIALSEAVAKTIKTCMALLGINVPEKM